MRQIIQKCSNCGKTAKYSGKIWKGREFTACHYCGHTLSITTGFLSIDEKHLMKIIRKGNERRY